ncbi:hypothetical protein AB6Q56_08830 [Dechloromonas sp. ARDL1]|uniref:hypothetical protein n=1 Tax=Dechloromonas sp. ARDL1 TaxID=3322121 RepID=UPI003DA74A2B
MDRRIDHSSQSWAISRLQGLAAGPLASLGQFLERVRSNIGCCFAHFAARLIGQRLTHLVHDISTLLVGHAQGVACLGCQTSQSCNRQGNCLAGEVGPCFTDRGQRVFQGSRFQDRRAIFRIRQRREATLRMRRYQRTEATARRFIKLLKRCERHGANTRNE